MISKKLFLTLLLSTFSFFVKAQETTPSFFLRDEQMVLVLDLKAKKASIDSLLKVAGITTTNATDILSNNFRKLITERWLVDKKTPNLLHITRSLQDLSYIKGNNLLAALDQIFIPKNYKSDAQIISFGINSLIFNHITDIDKTNTRFLLVGYNNAKKVILAGSFNDWSTSKIEMQRTPQGWVATVPIEPGKHLYKFIVDGYWMDDLLNKQTEPDGESGKNSIYFKPNHTFKISGYQNAQKVILSGDFNNWNKDDLSFKKVGNNWELPIYLKEGSHQYHFLVDNQILLDPQNPSKAENQKQQSVSILNIGNPTIFTLDNSSAQKVYLAGNFNNWNPEEIAMKKVDGKWTVSLFLPAGNYNYKFIVDKRWITDPKNPHQSGWNEEVNSFIAIKENHTFKLKGYLNAKTVRLAGSFNNWDEAGYTLKKVVDGWEVSLNFPKGKHRYKFLVDGNWILDPTNKLWEQNEFYTGNSVIWIE